LTEIHSKLASGFATIHQVVAIQCISQHPYIVAVGRVIVEALDFLVCSFILSLFTEIGIKIPSVVCWCSLFYDIIFSNKLNHVKVTKITFDVLEEVILQV